MTNVLDLNVIAGVTRRIVVMDVLLDRMPRENTCHIVTCEFAGDVLTLRVESAQHSSILTTSSSNLLRRAIHRRVLDVRAHISLGTRRRDTASDEQPRRPPLARTSAAPRKGR